ncbi:MAG: hypothetical protein ACLUU1_07670 [Ruminococcus sp.]
MKNLWIDFEGDEFSVAEISAALAMCVGDGSIVPVCMGSPVNLQGVKIFWMIFAVFPKPESERESRHLKKSSEIFEANYESFDRRQPGNEIGAGDVWKTGYFHSVYLQTIQSSE